MENGWDERWSRSVNAPTGIMKDRTVRVCFSERVGKKELRKASGNSSSQIKESNPVLQIKYFHGTKCLLERLTWISLGGLASKISFLSQT